MNSKKLVVDGDSFIIAGSSEIRVYNSSGSPISTFSDLGSIRTVAYKNGTIAAGLTSGKTILISTTAFKNGLRPTAGDEDIPRVLSPRNARPVNAVSFNENGYLAIGMDKARGESLLVYDLSRGAGGRDSSMTRGGGSDQKPIAQFGSAEAVYSAAFLPPSAAHSIIVASFSKYIRLFDLRSSDSKGDLTSYSSKANGIHPNPTNLHQFLTHDEERIQIFDLRNITVPVLTFSEANSGSTKGSRGGVLEVSWNNERRGSLGVLNDSSNFVKIWNILDGSSDYGKLPVLYDDSPSRVFTQTLSSFGFCSNGPAQSIIGVLKDLNPGIGHKIEFLPALSSPSLSTFTSTGISIYPASLTPVIYTIPTSKDLTEDDEPVTSNRERRSRSMSSAVGAVDPERDSTIGPLERRPSKVSDEELEDTSDDLSALCGDSSVEMRRRVENGYGLRPEVNVELMDSTSSIKEFWMYMSRAELLATESFVLEFDFSYRGALEILAGFPSTSTEISQSSYFEALKKFNNQRRLSDFCIAGTKLNEERKAALNGCCGIDWEKSCFSTCERLKLEEPGGLELAARHAVLNGKFSEAIVYLQASSEERLRLLGPILAAYIVQTEPSTLFESLCRTLSSSSETSWIRALLAFLASKDWREFIDESGLPIKDRIAVALRVLPDVQLLRFLQDLRGEFENDLEAVRIVGIRSPKLLSAFLDRTGDIQTVALGIAFIYPIIIQDSKKFERWIQTYRSFLDNEGLDHARAIFDGLRGRKAREAVETMRCLGRSEEVKLIEKYFYLISPPQFLIRCTYCSITISSSTERPSGGFKSTLCPSCSKSLPNCTICLRPVSTEGSSIAFCQNCKHGGHTHHLLSWFERSEVCPVVGCSCQCIS